MADTPITSSPIEVEYLKYGKLVSPGDQRVPYSEGYGVTRRSKGLKSEQTDLLQPRQILRQRLETTLVDPAAEAGVFACRYHYDTGGRDAYILMMRAVYRPEGGAGEAGRVFQQSEGWLVRWADWKDHSKAIFDCAARDLKAAPDFVDPKARERLQDDPIKIPRIRNIDFDTRTFYDLPEGSIAILDALRRAESEKSVDLVFGAERPFLDEPSFLSAIGVVFEILPAIWSSKISIVCGFLGTLGNSPIRPRDICVRYVKAGRSRPPVESESTRAWLAREIEQYRSEPNALKFAPPHILASRLGASPSDPAASALRDGARAFGVPLAHSVASPRGGAAFAPAAAERSPTFRAPQWPDARAEYMEAFDEAARTRSKIETIVLLRCVKEINASFGAQIRSRAASIMVALPNPARCALTGLSSLLATPSWSSATTLEELVETIRVLSPGGDQIRPLLETSVRLLDARIRSLCVLIPDEIESLTKAGLYKLFLAPDKPRQLMVAQQSALLASWVHPDKAHLTLPHSEAYRQLMSDLAQRYQPANRTILDRDANRVFVRNFVVRLFMHRSHAVDAELDPPIELRVLNLMLDYIVNAGAANDG